MRWSAAKVVSVIAVWFPLGHAFGGSPFDGTYTGTQTLIRAQTGSTQCNAGPYERTMRISDGKWLLNYYPAQHLTVAGSVGPQGELSGSALGPGYTITLTGNLQEAS